LSEKQGGKNPITEKDVVDREQKIEFMLMHITQVIISLYQRSYTV